MKFRNSSARRRAAFATASLLSALLLLACGCTIIGFVAGDAIDRSLPRWTIVPGWDVATLAPGESVEIITASGGRIAGQYVHVANLSLERYAANYRACVGDLGPDVRLPFPGDKVVVTTSGGVESRAVFEGLGMSPMPIVSLGSLDSGKAMGDFPLDRIKSVADLNGNAYDCEALRKLALKHEWPSRRAIAVSQDSVTTLVPMDSVMQIEVPYHSYGKVIGLVLGMAADGAVIYAMGARDRAYHEGYKEGWSEGYAPPYSGGSCPHVYSFDGKKYVMDSETFSGAIYQAAQRTDIDNLDHLKVIKGQCRLRIVNELPETDFVDALSLLVVDHPVGTRVIPDLDGTIHLISSTQSPLRATDTRGANLLPTLASNDDDVWISNPFGRDVNDPAQIRDGIELEFAKPEKATTAKLVINSQNTKWAPTIMHDLLKLKGRELPQFYDQINSSPMMRAIVQHAFVREGMLIVTIWTGTEWTEAGFVWGAGPQIPKDQVIALDISKVTSDTLRIRLESTPGLWMINSASLACGDDQTVTTTEVFAREAQDETGRDLKNTLREADSVYYELPSNACHAELTFDDPPKVPGLTRSYLLKSTGYYSMHLIAEGEPQTALITRMAMVPGEFSRYALQQIADSVQAAMTQSHLAMKAGR